MYILHLHSVFVSLNILIDFFSYLFVLIQFCYLYFYRYFYSVYILHLYFVPGNDDSLISLWDEWSQPFIHLKHEDDLYFAVRMHVKIDKKQALKHHHQASMRSKNIS